MKKKLEVRKMPEIIFECIVCNRRYEMSNGKQFLDEIDTGDEKLFRGVGVSHGYCGVECYRHDLERLKSYWQRLGWNYEFLGYER
jgi:hypothetical protein